jgi:hypothetical protein
LVSNHMTHCPDLAKLYQTDPSKVIPAEEEYARVRAEKADPEARAEAKDARLAQRFAEMDRKREQQVARWKPRDILDD